MDICQEDLMLSSDEGEGDGGGGNDDGIPEEVLKELIKKSDSESSDDESSECSSSSESSSSSSSSSSEDEDEDDLETAAQKKTKDKEESAESVAKRLGELLETMGKLPSSCSSFDDEHEPVKASSRRRKIFTKKREKCVINNASNEVQSTLAVHEDNIDDYVPYSSGSSTSKEDVAIMKSVSDDNDDSDSDFDPDVVFKHIERDRDASEDTSSVISIASSTATWGSLLACRKNNRKRRKLDTDNKFVRLSRTTLSINALKDEFFLSLGSSLAFSSLSSRSSELATAIVERASKTSEKVKKQQQARYENFSPMILTMPPPAVMWSKRITSAASSNISLDRYGYKPQLTPDVEFVNEIKTVIATYFSLVFLQRAMNNNNNNSSGYYEDMVYKMIGIINNVPREEMSHEKYQSVVRDALYIYCIVVSKLTGPEHLKRLRTPKQQSKFCYMIAMMVNNLPIDSDLSLAGESTNLVQFASGMSEPAYRMAVRNLSSVFNNSYSVNKALKLPPSYLVMVNQILSILSSKNTSLSERKSRTLAQSVYLYYDHRLRDSLRSSGLTSEESSLGAALHLVSQQLAVDGIDDESLEDGLCMAAGNLDVDGAMLKSLGVGQKDIKIVGLSTLLTQRFRKEARTIAIT